MISSEWLTPPRVSGIVAYGVAATCSGIAWARTRNAQKGLKIAALLTIVEGALLLDMIANGRWMLHQLFIGFAQRRHEYDFRRLPQTIVVAVLVGILLAGLLWTVRVFRARIGVLLAVSGVMLSVISWCVEVVSLHAVDAILYRPVGSLMVVSFVWILASLLTSFGILFDSHQANPGKQYPADKPQ